MVRQKVGGTSELPEKLQQRSPGSHAVVIQKWCLAANKNSSVDHATFALGQVSRSVLFCFVLFLFMEECRL